MTEDEYVDRLGKFATEAARDGQYALASVLYTVAEAVRDQKIGDVMAVLSQWRKERDT